VDIFLTQPGVAIALAGPGIPMGLFLDKWEGYPGFKSILTGIAVNTASGVQYMQTMRDLLFTYVFSERPAPLRLTGVSFAASCEQLADTVGPTNHGLEFAFAYYLDNRVSSLGTPLTIVLGLSTPFYGFLDKASFSVGDPEKLLGSFEFDFTTIPQPGALDVLLQ
jgi:hypothetical protein